MMSLNLKGVTHNEAGLYHFVRTVLYEVKEGLKIDIQLKMISDHLYLKRLLVMLPNYDSNIHQNYSYF